MQAVGASHVTQRPCTQLSGYKNSFSSKALHRSARTSVGIGRVRPFRLQVVNRTGPWADDLNISSSRRWVKWLPGFIQPLIPSSIKSTSANKPFLPFDQPLLELDRRIQQVASMAEEHDIDVRGQVSKLEERLRKLRKDVYSGLSREQRHQVLQHPDRPSLEDLTEEMINNWMELQSDSPNLGKERMLRSGIGSIDGQIFMFIGHQRTEDGTSSGADGDGSDQAVWLMKHANEFNFPVVTIVDLPGGGYHGKKTSSKLVAGMAELFHQALERAGGSRAEEAAGKGSWQSGYVSRLLSMRTADQQAQDKRLEQSIQRRSAVIRSQLEQIQKQFKGNIQPLPVEAVVHAGAGVAGEAEESVATAAGDRRAAAGGPAAAAAAGEEQLRYSARREGAGEAGPAAEEGAGRRPGPQEGGAPRAGAEPAADHLTEMIELRVPIISVTLGEGGLGGYLASGFADRSIAAEHALFHAPAGGGGRGAEGAGAGRVLSAAELVRSGVMDATLAEPEGAAHSDRRTFIAGIKAAILANYQDLKGMPHGDMVMGRLNKVALIGDLLAGNERT